MTGELRFYPEDGDVPDGVSTDRWVLEPLTTEHNAIDYAAVLATQARLRARTAGRWPRHGFTADENHADLARHQREHQERVAFTYTVLSLDRTQCVGCVYVGPVGQLLEKGTVTEGKLAPRNDIATVKFWTTPEATRSGIERALVTELERWFAADWCFERVFTVTMESDTEQSALFAEVSHPEFVLEAADEDVVYLGYRPKIASR